MLSSHSRYPRAAALSSFKPAAFAAVLIAAFAGASQAQTVPPAAGAGPGQSASERAAKEGDKVFQWIRIHADKPRKPAAPAAPEKTAVAPAPGLAKVAVRPATKPAATDAGNAGETASKAAPREERLAAAKPVSQPDQTTQPVETKDASAPALPATASPAVEVEEEIVLTPVTKSEPQFPGSLMRQLRKGLVQVAFTVQPDGSVTDAHAVSITHQRLSPSAVATVQQWKFQPIRQAQQAVVDLGFNLD